MSFGRRLAFLLIVGALAVAGWSIVHDHRRQDPDERLAEARALLQQGDREAAAAIARDVLARDPSHGRAFAILAPALAAPLVPPPDGTAAAPTIAAEPETLRLYETAARRAPRDVHVRAWLTARHLQAGDFQAAMPHLDALLTVSSTSREQALPLVIGLAADRGFAEVLAAHLVEHPRWRRTILRASLQADEPAAADHLHAALRSAGVLSQAEVGRWINGMLSGGRWGTAYAHWVSGLEQAPDSLPLLHNGDFSRPISSHGFDWRLRRTNGVVAGRVDAPGGGHALRMTFLGRNVGRTGLEQPLLLAPGRYRLELRARTRELRSHRGLEWQLTCSDNRTRIAAGATINRQPAWTPLQLEFEVPAESCEGQWLRLVNPAPRGVAQATRGELQFSNVAISRIDQATILANGR